jgi:O-antigen ligase
MLPKATHDGHRLAIVVVVAALLSAAVALAFASVESRVRAGTGVRRVYGGALLLVVAAAIVAAFVHYGGPVELSRRAYDSFTSPPLQVATGTSLNKRLFSFSSNGRIELWRIAVHDFEAHPLAGSGAGSYEGVYLLHRQTSGKVRDAHSLYVETLAELGIVGLALLVLALLVPVVGAVRARRHPLVPIAFGAYVALLVHAGVDWDWEVTAVTLAGLLCGAAIVLAARGEGERQSARFAVATRVGLLALIVAICVVSFVGLIGNTAIASSQQAIVDGRWARAASQAERAIRWAPWSPQGRQYLGEAQFALGHHSSGLANVGRAIRQDPRDWDLRWTLALLTHGNTQKQATLAALRLNPRSPELAEWIAGVGLKLPAKP